MKALIKGILFFIFVLIFYHICDYFLGKQPVFLSNTYQQANNIYTLKYPYDWLYTSTDKAGVIFSGPKDTPAFFTVIKIELLTANQLGNQAVSISDLVKDYTEQLSKQGKVIDFGNLALPSDPEHIKGMYVTILYQYNGNEFKKTQYFLARDSSQKEFYLWSYTALEKDYDLSLPTAQAMFDSWIIRY
ncbi:hypothetical protein [Legionella sp. km772]|uniref:hypothetical protein n=1 Tax=Legionella sp. km772 TaxID=2498111 RepID=UPI000F8CAB41|nr:hypothetical protein [Legionella sp. km772]RUR05776.1 hypothetical protein ELY15_13920 [Legionella sp. km772]